MVKKLPKGKGSIDLYNTDKSYKNNKNKKTIRKTNRRNKRIII